MSKGYSTEHEIKLYDDDSGEFTSVTEDADGLGLVELRQHDQNGKTIARITLTLEAAKLFHSNIGEYLTLKERA